MLVDNNLKVTMNKNLNTLLMLQCNCHKFKVHEIVKKKKQNNNNKKQTAIQKVLAK